MINILFSEFLWTEQLSFMYVAARPWEILLSQEELFEL